ncbi:uncharacterized protein Z519_09603 [Cladophialophora bantiana CBS 173.52]|uniref:Uncharacterized protein n=1 Tax=Cladophialophora bantiana (strain ATCC 10958 / CBS 173.52 / CDC B-1940 / NIH 8579) TaxID=1442370 RepID=A0A0D2FSA5_CLAB1|nr:uncharacterized protein Z519_09603 [Cladophialophora bantiana CBS 173.52]KIW89447.1 hypothetical protein Z519_09603 [Cladophialophora bantiana CBS 173.52]
MHQSVLIPQTFLPVEAIKLGRIVLNVADPQSDFLDPISPMDIEVVVKSHSDFIGHDSKSLEKGFSSTLTRLVSISRSKQKKTLTSITADRVVTHQISNSGKWFNQALENEATRKWIEQANNQGDDVYLVVGYHTMFDAQVVEGGSLDAKMTAHISLPIAEALAAAGVVIPLGDMIDPSVGGHRQQQQGQQKRFVAAGEQICAVQYRKLRFKWYSSSKMDDPTLGPSKWKSYLTFRGQTDDVVEVDLEDELELGDEVETYVFDGQESFFSLSAAL